MAKAREIAGLSGQMAYRQAAALTVRTRAAELWEHSANVLDTADIERVHDMRVATRRLRAVLEIYEPCFRRKAFRDVLRDVKRLADALGARRDPDVQLEELEGYRAILQPSDQAGLDLFAAGLREEQAAGNALLAAEIRRVQETDLRGRLNALADDAQDRIVP
jgi:CHAD domain-containing protein